MPHAIIEYARNLDGHIDRQILVEKTHEALEQTGVFPLAGIRVRLYEITHYKMADGHEDNGFIHVHIRVGQGRDEETRVKAAKAVFDHLAEWLEPVFSARPFALSVELNEIPGETSFKRNNLHENKG